MSIVLIGVANSFMYNLYDAEKEIPRSSCTTGEKKQKRSAAYNMNIPLCRSYVLLGVKIKFSFDTRGPRHIHGI